MRSNSGKDEGRNNLHDPTVHERELGRDGGVGTSGKEAKSSGDHRGQRKD